MNRYGQTVVRLAFSYVKNKQLAEDISQEVFISCYKNLTFFRKESTYKTWIYKITINKCRDVMKSWSYKNLIFIEMITSMRKTKDSSIEESIIKQEENYMISQSILHLPAKLREVMILYYYEELKIEEISKLLELKTNTIKTRLH
ncbi:sigma-70 family RNA polymerase sigma factor, partial [Bacillaceae bacterium Marseille-Q3522]|nr:sigma-70 family RNA polymerase sigma factor [Bacillaceae bacterium Marseille-Q3522]